MQEKERGINFLGKKKKSFEKREEAK